MQMYITGWGNNLGVRIPKDFARQLGTTQGTVVDVTAEGDRLDELLEGMTPDAMHEALDWDGWEDDVGREDVA